MDLRFGVGTFKAKGGLLVRLHERAESMGAKRSSEGGSSLQGGCIPLNANRPALSDLLRTAAKF
jgi:hypothetical protein